MSKREDPRTTAARVKFEKEVKRLCPDGDYVFLEPYAKSTVPIKVRHTSCGHEWKLSPVNFYHGRRCPVCRGGGGVKDDAGALFKARVKQQLGDEYTVIGEYKGTHSAIEIRHNVCERVTKVSPTNFLKKTAATRCIHCQREEKISQGERAVKEWLEQNGLEYIHQYRASELNEMMNNHRYTFDFMVPYDDGTHYFIEFQGELHYRPWRGDSKSAIKKFENTQKNDKLKADYCAAKGIPLLIISYKDLYRIDKILKKFFF